MQVVLRQRGSAEGVRDVVHLKEVIKIALPDVADQRPCGFHDHADEALVGHGKVHSLGAQCPRLTRAVASGHTKDAGGLVINKCKLPRVQVAADAFKNSHFVHDTSAVAKLLQNVTFGQAGKDAHEQRCASFAAVLMAPKAM